MRDVSACPWAWLLALGLGFGSIEVASAQEWTRFRGPNGTGISETKGIPTRWTEKDYLWTANLPAGGHSSPVVWGDLVFLTGADEEKSQRMVFAVTATTGQVLWSKGYDLAIHKRHKLNSFASPTCAVDAEQVYASWTTPEEFTVKAFSHAGNEVWSRNLGPFVSQHSGGASPIVYDDLLIVTNDQDIEGGGSSAMLALNRQTGETVWSTERTSDIVTYSTPCVRVTPDGGEELICNSKAHGICGLNPRTGHVNWEVGGLFDKRSCSSSIMAAGDIFIGSCGSGGGGNYVVGVTPGSAKNPQSGKLVYKVSKQAPYVPTPLAYNDQLFLWFDGGIVTCVDPKTGDTLGQKRVGGTFYGSPICVEGRLYASNTAGDVYVLSATPELTELAVNPLGETSHATPAVSGGRLFLRTERQLFALGKK
jgi:outer membrane protein assembly factor BamB